MLSNYMSTLAIAVRPPCLRHSHVLHAVLALYSNRLDCFLPFSCTRFVIPAREAIKLQSSRRHQDVSAAGVYSAGTMLHI